MLPSVLPPKVTRKVEGKGGVSLNIKELNTFQWPLQRMFTKERGRSTPLPPPPLGETLASMFAEEWVGVRLTCILRVRAMCEWASSCRHI